MSLFNGLTHAIIKFNTIAGEAQSGIGAMMKLCFGSDENSISQIYYKKVGPSTYAWTLPERSTVEADYAIFLGSMAEEITLAAGRTAERFKNFYKTEMGLKAGRSWRVTTKGIEEITTEATPAK